MITRFYFIGFNNSVRTERFLLRNQNKALFELVTATNGQTMPHGFVNSLFSASYIRYQQKNKGQHWLNATLGCLLSHIRAIEHALNSGASHAVIAEDDAVFHREPAPYIAQMQRDGYDLVYLNNRMKSSNKSEQPTNTLIQPLRGEHIIGTGGEGYALSAKGMRTALDVFNAGLAVGLPTGFDGFLQSFSFVIHPSSASNSSGSPEAIIESLSAILSVESTISRDLAIVGSHAVDSPRWKQLRSWVLLRNENIKVGLANPCFVTHEDGGESIINATVSPAPQVS